MIARALMAMVGLSASLALLVEGCAQRTDWVEGTLVTVDVTGVWKGRTTTGVTGEMEMTLTQRGAKVTGEGRIRADRVAIEGTVRGDMFSFNAGGRLRAEAQIDGDRMSGQGRTNVGASGSGQPLPFRFTLTR